MAANGIPIATGQLLGRWSSKAVEKYTQAAPLALAPVAPAVALGNLRTPGLAGDPGGLGLMMQAGPSPPEVGGGDQEPGPGQLAPAGPAIMDGVVDPPLMAGGSQGEPVFDPGTAEPAEVARDVVAQLVAPFVLLSRTRKLHRAATQESDSHRGWWSAPCGWKYGTTQFYRLEEIPEGANKCRRCFPGEAEPEAESVSSSSGTGASTSSSESYSD